MKSGWLLIALACYVTPALATDNNVPAKQTPNSVSAADFSDSPVLPRPDPEQDGQPARRANDDSPPPPPSEPEVPADAGTDSGG